jgi:hypothetical protein
MAKQCLFCNNEGNSKEHLWSEWILQRLGVQPTRIKIGKTPARVVDHSVMEIRCVCIPCNGGWMSAVEVENIPAIGCLMQDIATPLDAAQQTSLALWAVQKAMVLDAVNAKDRGNFFTRAECEALKDSRTIPDQTYVWIGAYQRSGYSADGTIVSLNFPNAPNAAKASVTTFVIGHLAMQVVSVHPNDQHKNVRVGEVQLREGEWDTLLVQVWPVGTRPLSWPPPLTFTNGGKRSIATLLNRWRIGRAV